jgi:hypothetical protein
MSPVVNGQQLIGRDMRIALSRTERGVPQHFLDRAQICTFVKQVRCKGMAQDVRTHWTA